MKHNSTRILNYAAPCLLWVAASIPSALHAVPAYPGVIMAEQPDGTTVPVMIKGDERGHRAMTTDGYMLLRNAEGFLTYATVDTEGLPVASSVCASAPELRTIGEKQFLASLKQPVVTRAFETSARMSAIAREGGVSQRYLCSGAAFPASGSPRALVILVEFQDKEFSMSDPGDFYSRMLNEEGFAEYNATGSARDFFVENSHGLFTPQFDVYGPVTLTYPMRHYGANDSWGQDVAPEEVVIEACSQLDDTVDFSVYDTNGDGQIDNVFIFYAGYGEADSLKTETIWPHSADIKDFYLQEDYYFDGLLLNRYGMTNELDFQRRRPDGIGTFVHEFSHVMGLPDIYATDYTSSFTPGAYCTLDMGPYNNNGRTPPHYGVFERYCLDWLEPDLLETSGEYELEAIHKSNKAFLIRTENPDEFYLLENRQQECCDSYIPGHGMLVWHVDYVEKVWNDNIVNNTPSHQYVDLVEADNKRDEKNRDGDSFPGTSNVTQFSDRTRPELRSWDGESLGISLSNIREEDGKILFTASVENTGVADMVSPCAGIMSDGNAITNNTSATAEVFDLAGVKVAEITAGESVVLNPGIYVVTNGEARLKIRIL